MRRALDLCVLLLFGAATAWLGWTGRALAVDLENASMRSSGTPEQAAIERRESAFGRDSTAIFLLDPPPHAASDASARAWLAALAEAPGALHARALPAVPSTGGLLAAVELEADPDGAFAPAFARVDAAARAAAPAGWRVSATAQVAGQTAISAALRREEARVVPLLCATLALVLLALYRSPVLLVAAFLPAVGALFALDGVQVLLGRPLDPISTLLPPTLLAVGVAGAIHVIEGTLSALWAGAAPRIAPGLAARRLCVPAALALATTIAGLLGLAGNAIPAVRGFGLLASLGVTVAGFHTLVVVPAWLRLWRVRPRASRGRVWDRLADPLAARLRARSTTIVAASALLGALALAAWTRLAVDNDPLAILPERHPFRVETERIAHELGGIETFDLLLEAPHPPAASLRVAALASALADIEGVVGPAGPPRTAADGTRLLPVLLAPTGSRVREGAYAAVEARARAAGFAAATACGATVQIARDSMRLVHGQLQGFGVSVALVALMMVVGLRSLPLGLLGMVPNVLPCALVYAGLALARRPVNVATAMIGTVFLGLVIDDCVHFLHAYRHARASGAEREHAVARAFRRAGRPIVITSVALGAGFAACVAGRLTTTREFGVLASTIVGIALLANVLLLPALLLLRSAPCLPSTTDTTS